MNNATVIRTIVIYAICVPLAIFVGYQLTDPLNRSTFYLLGLLILGLSFPILLKWHHFLLVASWNLIAVLFFLQGQPPFWMMMVLLSLGISVLQRATNKDMRFISVPQVTASLICMLVIVLVTAKFTGGIGLRAFGSEVYGGKRYFYLAGAIIGYFALTAQRIPPERSNLYVAFFFLAGLTAMIGDMFYLVSPSFQFIFLLFPPNIFREGFFEVGTTRLLGLTTVSTAGFYFMMSKFGIRGIFSMNRPWRLVAFAIFLGVGFLGGFRSLIIMFACVFTVQFFLEGLHKTKLLFVSGITILLLMVLTVPLASKLPFTVQRSLAFLPLDLDTAAKLDAQGSTEWRLRMWRAVLPQVPQYLWLGKGYALSVQDFDYMDTRSSISEGAENWGAAIAGDYHNGPLSVLLTFGIGGMIAFVWFLVAGMRALYANYRYGPLELRTYNTFLFASFIAKTAFFFLVFGALDRDLLQFVGFLGLSVSLNGGVCRPSAKTVSDEQRPAIIPNLLSRRRPAFQR